MPGEQLSEDVKAAIQAALITGTKPKHLKEKYGVSLPTITRIKQSIAPDIRTKMDLDRQAYLADLVLHHLEASLEGAINVTDMTRNPEWMQQQTADGLNKLYGTMSDKAIRMAETIEITQKQIREEDADEDILSTNSFPNNGY